MENTEHEHDTNWLAFRLTDPELDWPDNEETAQPCSRCTGPDRHSRPTQRFTQHAGIDYWLCADHDPNHDWYLTHGWPADYASNFALPGTPSP